MMATPGVDVERILIISRNSEKGNQLRKALADCTNHHVHILLRHVVETGQV